VRASFSNEITWRGLEYRVEKGLLIPAEPSGRIGEGAAS